MFDKVLNYIKYVEDLEFTDLFYDYLTSDLNRNDAEPFNLSLGQLRNKLDKLLDEMRN